MTRPATYAVQDGCWNCRHVWTPRREWLDDTDHYICLHGAQPARGETTEDMLDRLYDSNTCNVDPAGKCGEWLGPDTTQEGGE